MRTDLSVSPVSCPPFLPPAATTAWAGLHHPTGTAAGRFDRDSTAGLPAPVARWLHRSIVHGTPLLSGVELSMHGTIRIGRWMPFTARQIVGPTGYLWAAQAGRFPIMVRGFDRYSGATGQMAWRLFGRIPVVSAAGADITRSAAGRLASEIIGLTPGGALGSAVAWEGIDDDRSVGRLTIDGTIHDVTIDVAADGALRSLSLPRWAKPGKREPFRLHTFGVFTDGELKVDGYTLPRTVRAGWWPGTPQWEQGEFFRATIDQARFF